VAVADSVKVTEAEMKSSSRSGRGNSRARRPGLGLTAIG